MLKHLPNAMTCGNLLCGCLGIYATLTPEHSLMPTDLFGQLTIASVLIFIAGVLDFGDGFVARLVNAQSPIGKELDSLADMVTFGVLPAFMLQRLLTITYPGIHTDVYIQDPFWYLLSKGPLLIPLLMAVSSALRLAKFNVDTRQSDQFIGVPTPANALLVASLPFILLFQEQYRTLILNPYVLIGYVIIMSWLMVSELPLMAFKFKSFSWQANQVKYSFLIASVLLLIVLQFAAIPLIILLYILLSILTKERKSE